MQFVILDGQSIQLGVKQGKHWITEADVTVRVVSELHNEQFVEEEQVKQFGEDLEQIPVVVFSK